MMKAINRKYGLLLAIGGIFCAASANAQVLKNGDFSNGKGHWEGAGKIVTLNDAGEPAKPEEGGKPVLELKLSRQNVTEIRQRLVPAQEMQAFKAEAMVMVSSDFQRNDKAQPHAKDAKKIKWEPSGWYARGKLYYPCVDFCLRVKDADRYYYLPRPLSPGTGWQKLGGNFKEMALKGDKILALVLPAGEGTVWVKSVIAEPL